jgi:hypothetical protein
MFEFILTVILVMPGDQKDISQSHDMSSLEACMSAATAWLEQDAHAIGGVGLAAGCSKNDPEDRPPA